SLERAIALNGVAVETNRRAFLWGRALAHDPGLAEALLGEPRRPLTLEALVAERADELVRYQGEALARRYRALVERAVRREAEVAGEAGPVARAVAEAWFHVLACKDEYEVARLHTDPAFLAGIRDQFGDAAVTLHLSPPIPFLGRDPATGRRRKLALPGRVMLPLFRLLARGRAIRGSWLDPFRWQSDRRLEREMIRAYEADVAQGLAALTAGNGERVARLLRWPFAVRGFGPVKRASHARAMAERAAALAALAEGPRATVAEAAHSS
ncbi:MAG: DUF6537 domain-containing protein, partial [Acetobacteraceae bacterium]